MLKPSACNLAIIKSSGEQSNNLDRIVSLSVHFFKNLSALFKLVNEAVWYIDSFVESQLIK